MATPKKIDKYKDRAPLSLEEETKLRLEAKVKDDPEAIRLCQPGSFRRYHPLWVCSRQRQVVKAGFASAAVRLLGVGQGRERELRCRVSTLESRLRATEINTRAHDELAWSTDVRKITQRGEMTE